MKQAIDHLVDLFDNVKPVPDTMCISLDFGTTHTRVEKAETEITQSSLIFLCP
jgi:hypothetical protein